MVVRIIADLSNRLGLKPLLFKFSLFVVNRVFTYVIKPHIAYRIWLLSDRKEIGIESAKSKET